MMPKFLVSMNVVEAKTTNFIIETESEDDIHDAFGEENFGYPFFDENCKWVTSEFEPPTVGDIKEIKGNIPYIVCTKTQNNKIQKLFNKTIKQLDEAN